MIPKYNVLHHDNADKYLCLFFEVQTKTLYNSGLLSFKLLLSKDLYHPHLVHSFFDNPTPRFISVHIVFVYVHICISAIHKYSCILDFKITFMISNVDILFSPSLPPFLSFTQHIIFCLFVSSIFLYSIKTAIFSSLWPSLLLLVSHHFLPVHQSHFIYLYFHPI